MNVISITQPSEREREREREMARRKLARAGRRCGFQRKPAPPLAHNTTLYGICKFISGEASSGRAPFPWPGQRFLCSFLWNVIFRSLWTYEYVRLWLACTIAAVVEKRAKSAGDAVAKGRGRGSHGEKGEKPSFTIDFSRQVRVSDGGTE